MTVTKFLVGLLCVCAFQLACAAMPRDSRVPGGIAYVEVPSGKEAPVVMYDGYRTAVVKRGDKWLAVVGIPPPLLVAAR